MTCCATSTDAWPASQRSFTSTRGNPGCSTKARNAASALCDRPDAFAIARPVVSRRNADLQRAVAAPADVGLPTPVGELKARRSRKHNVARRRAQQSGPDPSQSIGIRRRAQASLDQAGLEYLERATLLSEEARDPATRLLDAEALSDVLKRVTEASGADAPMRAPRMGDDDDRGQISTARSYEWPAARSIVTSTGSLPAP